LEASSRFSTWEKARWQEVQNFYSTWTELPEDSTERRQFDMISVLGTSALDEERDREVYSAKKKIQIRFLDFDLSDS
jgi:hypothetical protein